MSKMKNIQANFYTGERSHQLRDGFGVYYYTNRFFRYEGDWLKGKKHGHGKLIMADGSYYEGEFKNGEIEGHGFRKWQQTGDTYSGEFYLGEMHGYGVLNYADGSWYKGEFCHNCRHGNGVHRDKFGNEYEGTWHNNLQNGHAVLTFQNGDVYEGSFVRGYRQGHGLLRFADGGFYEGQWHVDQFSGEGKMINGGGVMYDGLWFNGKPALIAKELKLANDVKSVECQQGQSFRLRLRLVDQNRNVLTEETGRRFEITAAFKHVHQNKSHQSLLELIEDTEVKPIVTPYGYDVLPYPMLEYDPITASEITNDKLSSELLSVQDNFKLSSPENANDDSLLIKQASTTDSNTSIEDSKFLLQAPSIKKAVSNGILEFENLFLPYIAPKVPEETKSKKSKGSRTASAVSSSSSESKAATTSKVKIPSEKGATPGEYVIMIKDITDPPFLEHRLETYFTTVVVSVQKQVKKSKSKLGN